MTLGRLDLILYESHESRAKTGLRAWALSHFGKDGWQFDLENTKLILSMTKHSILCVDDEIDNVDTLERLLRKNYRVLKATSGKDGLLLLAQNPQISVIITDQRMPEMTGVEFLEKSLTVQPEAVRILLTGYTDLESVISAINLGQIHRYLTKPWDPVDLNHTVEQAIQRFEMSQDLKRSNLQLAKALEELKELDRTKTEFMILINHELKTPLTTLMSFLDLTLETNLTDEQKTYLKKVEASSLKLRTIVDDCLLIIKTLNRQISPNIQPLKIQQFETYMDEATRKKFTEKKLSIQKNFEALEISTDQVWFSEIMKRILSNAVKFSESGKPIHILHESTGRQFVITIENEGPQIQNLDGLFKPFFLDENIMNHSQGLGLGLAISKGLAEILNFKMNIENTPRGVRTILRFS